MPQPVFPAQVAYSIDQGSLNEEYTPSQTGGETFGYGDFVKLVANVVKLCTADPPSILGLSEVVSQNARLITPNGKVPIRTLSNQTVLLMSSLTVPVEATHLNVQYGITRDANGNWQVDVSKTAGSARVEVVRLDIAQGFWYVKVIPAFLPNTNIVS
jgi:hypothetical protein